MIARSGRNLTNFTLVKVMGFAFNISPELATQEALRRSSVSSNLSSNTLNLSNLNKHNGLEHDASLSRADYDGGHGYSFGKFIFDFVMQWSEGAPNISLHVAGAARWSRVHTERFRNRHIVYGAGEQFSSYAETVLYWLAMADPDDGGTRAQFIRIFFEEERLPYNEAWKPPTNQINGMVVANTILHFGLATPEKKVPWDLNDPYSAGRGSKLGTGMEATVPGADVGKQSRDLGTS